MFEDTKVYWLGQISDALYPVGGHYRRNMSAVLPAGAISPNLWVAHPRLILRMRIFRQ